jgi:hypothetical protein
VLVALLLTIAAETGDHWLVIELEQGTEAQDSPSVRSCSWPAAFRPVFYLFRIFKSLRPANLIRMALFLSFLLYV